jgi:hypoxanthine-DNA glycosylase
VQEQHPFEPIVFKNTKTLILGSFPSLKSFENSFYYSHPKNQFWKILSEISGYPINNKDQKIWLLKELHLGLWDIVKSCSRENSSDANLKDIVPNDIATLLKEYPNIKQIAFTSRFAQKVFEKYFKDLDIKTIYLPSPSPAYAAMAFEEKAKVYKEQLL